MCEKKVIYDSRENGSYPLNSLSDVFDTINSMKKGEIAIVVGNDIGKIVFDSTESFDAIHTIKSLSNTSACFPSIIPGFKIIISYQSDKCSSESDGESVSSIEGKLDDIMRGLGLIVHILDEVFGEDDPTAADDDDCSSCDEDLGDDGCGHEYENYIEQKLDWIEDDLDSISDSLKVLVTLSEVQNQRSGELINTIIRIVNMVEYEHSREKYRKESSESTCTCSKAAKSDESINKPSQDLYKNINSIEEQIKNIYAEIGRMNSSSTKGNKKADILRESNKEKDKKNSKE